MDSPLAKSDLFKERVFSYRLFQFADDLQIMDIFLPEFISGMKRSLSCKRNTGDCPSFKNSLPKVVCFEFKISAVGIGLSDMFRVRNIKRMDIKIPVFLTIQFRSDRQPIRIENIAHALKHLHQTLRIPGIEINIDIPVRSGLLTVKDVNAPAAVKPICDAGLVEDIQYSKQSFFCHHIISPSIYTKLRFLTNCCEYRAGNRKSYEFFRSLQRTIQLFK